MSKNVKTAVLNILSNSGGAMSIEDVISELKKLPQFNRQKSEALRPTVKSIFMEYKNEQKKESAESGKDTKQENPEKVLNKKRKNPIPGLNSENFKIDKYIFKPNIKLSNLGGMNEIISKLTEIISNPLNYYSAYKRLNTHPIKGILLCGPSGCGKTTLAYAVGGEFQIPFYKITGPDIISSLSGESEQILRDLFDAVIENAPSILFIDEIETIIGRRETANKEMEKRIVAQIMSCIDNINEKTFSEINAPVFIIGATSKPEFIDASMRRSGRFDLEMHIGFPSIEMRQEMLRSITAKNKVSEKIDFYQLAKNTPGFLAADLQALVSTAGHSAINRYIKEGVDLENLYIEQEDFELALKTVQPASKREGFTTIPNVTWDDVGGLKDLRQQLYFDIVLPILDPKKLKMVGLMKAAGVLLYGPPGCGKTLLAKAVANEAKANFISIKGPELLNKYVGESERAIRSLFIRAKNSSPCIIFFDELDALVPKRSSENNNSGERVVNQLLTEMDGLEDRKQIFIIAATNRPDIIDPAMLRPGRLDKLMYVGLPDHEDREQILRTLTHNLPIEQGVDVTLINKGERLENYSGADLAAIVREAQVCALKRGLMEDNLKIIQSDFNAALEKVFPSVSSSDRKKYEMLREKIKEQRSHLV